MATQLQPLEAEVISTSVDDIGRLATQVFQYAEPDWSHVERRNQRRRAYPTILGVTLLIDGTLEPARETRFVVRQESSQKRNRLFPRYAIPRETRCNFFGT